MTAHAKITWIALFFAAASWFTEIVINPSGFEWILLVAGVLFSLLFFGFGAICLTKKLRKKVSPYRVFAFVNGGIGLAVLAYAIYDIQTDTGWFAGLFGVLLILFVIPVVAALLLADFIAWVIGKTKSKTVSLPKDI